MILVVILCQGQQRRMKGLGRPKQLLEVAGESILRRTHNLVRRYLPEARIVTIGRDALDADADELWTLPNPGTCIVDGIHATMATLSLDHFRGRVIFLLGDVVFSGAAAMWILTDLRDLVFAGTPDIGPATGELFAMAVSEELMPLLRDAVDTCPCRRRPVLEYRCGHLRNLMAWCHYRLQLPIEKTQVNFNGRSVPLAWNPEIYLPVVDWTTDMDTPRDAERLRELGCFAAAEFLS